jgi:phage tail-like protein
MSDAIYPLPGFYFTLRVLEKPSIEVPHPEIDASFQEISGIEAEFDTEPVVEGGENRFVHRLPKQGMHPNLVLKRGVTTNDSFLAEWIAKTVVSNLTSSIQPHDLIVTLLNERGGPAITWTFANAYPVKYSVSALNSQENKILIETLELAYNYFKRDVPEVE